MLVLLVALDPRVIRVAQDPMVLLVLPVLLALARVVITDYLFIR